MKTKAVVAWKAGQPLTPETVDLEGQKFGEVLVEDINKGFELMKRGESIRGVVLY